MLELQACHHAQLFDVDSADCTQVFGLARQALYWLSYFPSPNSPIRTVEIPFPSFIFYTLCCFCWMQLWTDHHTPSLALRLSVSLSVILLFDTGNPALSLLLLPVLPPTHTLLPFLLSKHLLDLSSGKFICSVFLLNLWQICLYIFFLTLSFSSPKLLNFSVDWTHLVGFMFTGHFSVMRFLLCLVTEVLSSMPVTVRLTSLALISTLSFGLLCLFLWHLSGKVGKRARLNMITINSWHSLKIRSFGILPYVRNGNFCASISSGNKPKGYFEVFPSFKSHK